jgi:uncharacterized membrane protein
VIRLHPPRVKPILPRVSRYGGEVLHTSLSTEAEEMLREALSEGPGHQQAS